MARRRRATIRRAVFCLAKKDPRGRNLRKYTEAEEAGICKDYVEGLGIGEIERKYRTSYRCFSRVLKSHGIALRRGNYNYHAPRKVVETGTKCWVCQKACGTIDNQCSWARSFEPIKGWNARKCKGSYFVRSCPEFVHDEPRRKVSL